MSPEVTVHVNRGSADSLETAVGTLETRDSFTLVLRSHGAPAHVHCRLHGDLERIATLETSNYYVEADGETIVPVRLATEAIDAPIEGELEVLTGYGSESLSIPVVANPAPAAVDIDESLAEPAASGPEPSVVERGLAATGLEPGTLAVVALGLFAVGIGALTAATIGGPVATLGIAIVVVGLAVALFLLTH
ncbi:hypothetical protein GS429_18570 [Natronorubrum sp. JWXQ-INN-674]|uniref:Uncharacterized protein n=1 Tax=Natronorubrum halalkaliphilum TaxID=2691917 RepID=A0A6B0VQB9_9EURY|nr:hypothetical protein [Natronorubrum halalkaliphilum]MXV64031.1 hypothetical protein [Natronorubrum halalkaliphilum]